MITAARRFNKQIINKTITTLANNATSRKNVCAAISCWIKVMDSLGLGGGF